MLRKSPISHTFLYGVVIFISKGRNYISIYLSYADDEIDSFCGAYCTLIGCLPNTNGQNFPMILEFCRDMLFHLSLSLFPPLYYRNIHPISKTILLLLRFWIQHTISH